MFLDALGLSILFAAVIFDLLKHKIPNLLLIILVIVNLLFREIIVGLHHLTFEGIFSRFVYLALIFAMLFPFFSVGALGAGDVKLILVTALVMRKPLYFVLLVFAIAAVESVIKILCAKNVKVRFIHLREYFRSILRFKTIIPYEDFSLTGDDRKRYSIHLSVPILLAAVIIRIGSHIQ